MRTTIDIDDDVLVAAKEIARRQHVSAGKVVSALLRKALTGGGASEGVSLTAVGGFRPFSSPDARIVTNEQVDRLRDEEGI